MVMPADISKLAKMSASVPVTAADFIQNLKVFNNLLYALFTCTSPLFKQLKELTKALDTYNPKTLQHMTKKTRGSILWIITLQTRHFFRGEISILAEFQLMKNKLTARDPLIYLPCRSPGYLIAETEAHEATANRRTSAEAKHVKLPPAQKQKQNKQILVHPLLLKHFVNGIWKQNPALQMRDLCKHCNCTSQASLQTIHHVFCLSLASAEMQIVASSIKQRQRKRHNTCATP